MKSRLFVLKCSAAALIGLAPLAYMTPAAAVDGYVTSGQDPQQPVRTRYGECVHDRGWQPGMRYSDCEPAPVVPVAAPASAPQVVEAPAPAPAPLPQNVAVRLSMETFFDFDKSVLNPGGQAALDEIASRLAVTQFDAFTIVGHADRIGPANYNQKLSERRARAMADYLIAKGVDAQKIDTVGLGQQNPSAQCRGLRGARLISCLQPDRYAEMTVAGTTVQASAAGSTAPAN